MESKKINQLATSVSPQTSDLTIIGDPTTGVSKKITLLQIANLFATTGTVSSVAVTETGDALTITGSPITSTGTINIGFAGDATQYVRGDGALADFPTSTGGGSSVSYYLNSSVSQGTIGGVAYKELSKDPISGAGTDITISADGYVASYITDANDPALLEVPGGNFNCEFYFSVNSNAHNPYVYAELYKYDGSTFTLLGSSQSVPEYLSNGTTLSPYYFAIPVATAALTITDRLAIRIYVNVDGRVVTLHTENNHLCQVVTTFSKGLISLNNLTRQNQFFGTGTSGTDFAISSSTATHTFNLPVASATNTGKLSSTDWSTFNSKYNLPSLTSGSVLFSNGTTIAQNNANFFWDNTNSFLGVGTNVPSAGVTSFSATAATQFKAAGTAPAITFSNTLTSASLACVFGLATSNNQFITGTAAGDMAIANQSTSAGAIVFGTGTTEKMRMTSAGTFSIGNTNSTFNLDVTGTGRFTGVLTLGSTISNGTYTYTLPSATGTLALTSQLTGGTVTSVGLSSATSGVTIGSSPITTSGTITLAIATASGSQNGLLSSTDWTTFNSKGSGSVTSVAALTIGTTGTDLSSTVANSTTTPVITLNVPTASAANRGALSSTDWTTFNGKQAALNGTGFVIATGTTISYDNSTYLTTSAAASTYLSLSGGTLTGALNINVNSGTGLNVATENVVFRASPTYGSPRQLVFSMGSGPTTTLEAKGYGANYITDFNIKTYNSAGTGFDVFFGTSGGNVGIGTSSPEALANNTTLQIDGTSHSFVRTGTSTYGGYFFTIPTADVMGLSNVRNPINGTFSNVNKAASVISLYGESNNAYITFSTSGTNNTGPSERMRISANGFILLGTFTYNNTTTNLPNAFIDTTGGVYRSTTSSIKVKDNIADWNGNGLDTILALKPKTFTYKESYYKHPELEMLGLIAEEVAEVSPYLAEFENEDRTGEVKNVKYATIVVPLIKAIQELEARIKQLENK